MSAELHALSASALAGLVRSAEVSASEVLEHHIARIERFDPVLRAFTHLDVEAAREAARGLDRHIVAGRDPGPLAGLPLGVKELQAVEGWPFTYASAAFSGNVATHTDTVVRRAVAAGAIAVGQTASPEFGRSAFIADERHGVVRNPWDVSRSPGGSSSGSAAAVAAGMLPLATGSDGAGSIRIPASWCGLVGFKATFGRLPQGPRISSSGCNVTEGALTRTVGDTIQFFEATMGPDGYDQFALPRFERPLETMVAETDVRGLRVAWSPDLGFAPCDPSVAEIVRQAADALIEAAGLVEVARPVSLPDATSAFRTLNVPDMYRRLHPVIRGEAGRVDVSVRQYYEPHETLRVADTVAAEDLRFALVSELAEVFGDVDLLVTPATQTAAISAEGPMATRIVGQDVGFQQSIGVTFSFNLAGNPAISVPAGTLDGVPVGLQIVGRRHEDLRVLAAAAIYEAARPWPRIAPGLELDHAPPSWAEQVR